jgi:glycerophosphoryl diester phosphodiesterase
MNIHDLKIPVIAAHRGVSSLFPENTMPAFIAALNLGCEMIELDISVTKDKEFVVIHDETLERTTSGTGKISDRFFAEIYGFDAGFKLTEKKISAKVPLLSEVLDLVKNRAVLNVEVKSEVYSKSNAEDSAEKLLLEMIEKREMTDQVILSSFNHKILQRLRKISDEVNLGILTSGEPRPPIALTRKLDAFSWHPTHINLSKKIIKYYKKHTGKKIIPYTVNKSKKASSLIKTGIDGFFTDYPQKFL